MLDPSEINVMKTLWQKRWRIKQIAKEMGHSKNTVRRYVRAWDAGRQGPDEGAAPAHRPCALAAVPAAWLKECLIRHAGNADVVRQELASELGVAVSLRTVERAVAPFRQEIKAETLATVRFETPPGRQIQVDFGAKTALIGGVKTKVHLCVLTLGYSRRIYVEAFRSERQADWFAAMEGAFRHFGGVAEEILVDNARALVDHNDGNGNVIFNASFLAFCAHWGIRPRACRPYRARTKGKDERAVGYVKRNAVAGRDFASWDDLEAHLAWWMREVADTRVHQTTKEPPLVRFAREAAVLLPVQGQRSYQCGRTWRRTVKTDATVDVQGNAYSVPYRLIGKQVDVRILDGRVRVHLDDAVVAEHVEAAPRSGARVITAEHLKGVMRLWAGGAQVEPEPRAPGRAIVGDSSLLRPLSEYEALFDGGAALASTGGAL